MPEEKLRDTTNSTSQNQAHSQYHTGNPNSAGASNYYNTMLPSRSGNNSLESLRNYPRSSSHSKDNTLNPYKSLNSLYATHNSANNNANTSDNSGVEDLDLVTVLTQRLTKVEETSKNQQVELSSKVLLLLINSFFSFYQFLQEHTLQQQAKQLNHLGDQLAQLMVIISNPSSANTLLQKERDMLRNQVSEMENFLHDYGLVWVGNEDSEGSDSESIGLGNSRATLPPLPLPSQLAHLQRPEEAHKQVQLQPSQPLPTIQHTQHEKEQLGAPNSVFKLDVEKIKSSIEELSIY